MKEYLAPEMEKIEYGVLDCLTGSKGIETESEDVGSFLEELNSGT